MLSILASIRNGRGENPRAGSLETMLCIVFEVFSKKFTTAFHFPGCPPRAVWLGVQPEAGVYKTFRDNLILKIRASVAFTFVSSKTLR